MKLTDFKKSFNFDRQIALSALQHYAFCPRQCALIHNEQVWAENWLTAQGRQLHETVDRGITESRKRIRYERAVEVSAPKLGLIGKLDLLEVSCSAADSSKILAVKPVEYKRGKPKTNAVDTVQLCAQALCLEEMLDIPVEQGAFWYWQIRRRLPVDFTEKLRVETLEVIASTRHLLESEITPKAIYTKKCKACSLYDLCNPQISASDTSPNYIKSLFAEITDEETPK